MNKVICGDALKELPKMDDNSVDLILTDPPYNAPDIGKHHRKYASGKMQLPPREYRQFCRQWFTQTRRICKRIVFTPGIDNIWHYPKASWAICWHKPAAPSFNRMGGYNAWEPILVYGKPPKGKRIGQDHVRFDVLNFIRNPEMEHPCPKPLPLIRWLVESFSNEDDLVLDCFAGSGTSGVACKEMGRRYVLIEQVPQYCAIIRKRLKQTHHQPKLIPEIDLMNSGDQVQMEV